MKRSIKALLWGVGIGAIGSLLTPTALGIVAAALLSIETVRRFVLWSITAPLAAEPQLYLSVLFIGEGTAVLLVNLLTKVFGG